jgi:hypothetical protein
MSQYAVPQHATSTTGTEGGSPPGAGPAYAFGDNSERLASLGFCSADRAGGIRDDELASWMACDDDGDLT